MRYHLTLETLPQHLESKPSEAWSHLFAFIPRIEQATTFGGWEESEGFLIYTPSALVDEFQQCIREMGLIVDFNWPHWDEGKALFRGSKTDYVHCSPITLVKLLTAIVRSDRFSEGVLVAALEDGKILQILRGLELHYGDKDESPSSMTRDSTLIEQ